MCVLSLFCRVGMSAGNLPDVGSAGDEHVVDGVALWWYDLVHQACDGRADS